VNRSLILLRHSAPEIRKDLPAHKWRLSEEGRRRTERLAERLILRQPEIIVTSPEPKARETAEILSQRLQLPLQENDDLREHRRLSAPYLPTSEFEAVIRNFFDDPAALVFGQETANQAHERFSSAVKSILSENDNRKTVIVSHATVISLFVSWLTGQPGFQLWTQLGLPSEIVLDMKSKKLIALENIS
jgi:broad specificity phosphatase PhoE